MKRQPLEEKIFSYHELSSAERRSLKKIVRNDPKLANLFEAWLGVESLLSAAEISTPKPGFKQRWLDLYQEDVMRKERIQAAWLTVLSATAAVALLILLMQRLTPSFDGLKQLLLGLLNGITEFVAFFQIIFTVSLSLLQKLPPSVWANIAAFILVLPLIWYAVFRELSFTKGVYK